MVIYACNITPEWYSALEQVKAKQKKTYQMWWYQRCSDIKMINSGSYLDGSKDNNWYSNIDAS